MKIKMVGTGSMITKRNPACYLINDKIMIDLPNGIVKVLKKADLFDRVEYVFITHMHGDHIFDLPFLFLDRVQTDRKLTVVLSKRWFKKLKKLVKLAFPRQYYNVFYNSKIEFIDNKNIPNIDSLNIERIEVSHGSMKPSYGYIFKENNKIVTFTGDTCLCNNIIDASKESDYMICDCTLKIGNEKHIGVDNIKFLLKNNPNLKIVPSHTSINSKECLSKINNKNLIIKEDMEEIII